MTYDESAWKKIYRQEHRSEIAAYNREYRIKHQQEIYVRQRAWAADHREQEYARKLQWIKDNPEKSREQSHRRRARLADVVIESVDEQKIYSLYGSCVYCGGKEDLTLDHVVPLNKGGAHAEDNLVVACRKCNGGKCDKTLEDWLSTHPRSLAWVF